MRGLAEHRCSTGQRSYRRPDGPGLIFKWTVRGQSANQALRVRNYPDNYCAVLYCTVLYCAVQLIIAIIVVRYAVVYTVPSVISCHHVTSPNHWLVCQVVSNRDMNVMW